MGECERN